MSILISIVMCLLFTALTGSVAYGFFWLICRINSKTNVLKSRYIILKAVILAFVIPICFLVEVKLRYENGIWVNSIFKTTPVLNKIALVFIFIWIIGILLRAVCLFQETKDYRLRVKTYQITYKYNEVLQASKKLLGIRRNIRVKEGEFYESPFITGVFAPTICLPIKKCDDESLKYIFLHELIHYNHRDMEMIYVIRVLSVIYWFHPVFWKDKLLLQYRELLEDACDIDVCRCIENHRNYIAVLIRMVLNNADIRHTAPVFLSENCKDVQRRIENIERYKSQKPLKRILVTALTAAVFCGSTVVVYAAENGVVSAYKKAYDATWEGMEEEMNGKTANTLEETYEVAVINPNITIEYVEDKVSTYSTVSYVDYTIAGNTEKRKSTGHALTAGDKVLVSLTVDPADKNVKVGFYMSNGYVRYITGSGNIYHTFTIYDDDTYRFFIQNNNSTTVDVDGYYSIQ